MAGATLTTLDKLFKNTYEPMMQQMYYTETPVAMRIRKRVKDSDFNGKKAIIPAHTKRSQSVGARGEDVPLPTPGSPGVENMETPVKYNYGTFRITRPTMKAARNSVGAWRNALKFVMDDIKESEAFDVARQMSSGDGTGRLAQVNGAVTAAATITVDNPGAQFLAPEMVIDIYNGSTLQADSVTILTVNQSTGVITVSANVTVADNAYIYREDAKDSEMMGLHGIVDDGSQVATFQGLSRATYAFLRANVMSNGGVNRPLTLNLIDEGYIYADENANGGYPDAIYSRPMLALRYAQLMKADRQYSPRDMVFDGGWRGVEYTGPGGTAPWIMDRTVRKNRIYMVREADMALWVLSPPEFVDDDGHILFRDADKDAFTGRIAGYEQLGAHRCDRMTLIADVSDT